MPKTRAPLALAALSIVAAFVATALYAEDARNPSGPMMGGGMSGGESMMGCMGQMMDHCAGMMSGRHGGTRPNDQWRKEVPPTAPDGKDR